MSKEKVSAQKIKNFKKIGSVSGSYKDVAFPEPHLQTFLQDFPQ